MNIYHTIKQIDQLLDSDGYQMAPAHDDGLAGLEDNSGAWYEPEGGVVVVTVNPDSIVTEIYDVDGDCLSRQSWLRTVDAKTLVAALVGDI